jgi:hypothetical protein
MVFIFQSLECAQKCDGLDSAQGIKKLERLNFQFLITKTSIDNFFGENPFRQASLLDGNQFHPASPSLSLDFAATY